MITHESSLNNFTQQLEFVLNNYKPHFLKADDFKNVIMGGLGGSGIGATIAKSWFMDRLSIPVETINDYNLPAFADENTLVILNSYSGNTEETLSLFEEAQEKGCKILAISSGGELKKLTEADSLQCYPLETGYQPRMTIGYGLSYLLLILAELAGEMEQMKTEIQATKESFDNHRDEQIQSAEKIFKFFKPVLSHKFVVLADKNYAAVGVRFSQQIQENAKLEAFVNVLPEANHNVLETYHDKLPSNFILLYTDKNPRVAARFDFVQSHLEMHNNKVLPLFIPVYSIRSIYDMIYRLDWVSVMIANELNAPLMEVPIITELKGYLSDLEIEEEPTE
jgi:glucose/mannose-6-phosphate isomerase